VGGLGLSLIHEPMPGHATDGTEQQLRGKKGGRWGHQGEVSVELSYAAALERAVPEGTKNGGSQKRMSNWNRHQGGS